MAQFVLVAVVAVDRLVPAFGIVQRVTAILDGREQRRCGRLACRMAGGRLNLILLLFATLLLVFELFLTMAPDLSDALLARLMT